MRFLTFGEMGTEMGEGFKIIPQICYTVNTSPQHVSGLAKSLYLSLLFWINITIFARPFRSQDPNFLPLMYRMLLYLGCLCCLAFKKISGICFKNQHMYYIFKMQNQWNYQSLIYLFPKSDQVSDVHCAESCGNMGSGVRERLAPAPES